MKPPSSRSDSRASQTSIADALRVQIVQGVLASGARLPNRRALVRHFNASSVTVQRAMGRLMEEGFVYTDGPNGTFVTPRPPHISRYGLLLRSHAGDVHRWRRFSAVLSNAARDLSSSERTIAVYENVDPSADTPGYRRLIRDLRLHRLAGVIAVGEPVRLFGTPVLAPGAPPRVALMEEPAGPGTPVVAHDRYAFLDQSLDYLRGRGRRRIASIHGERAPSNLPQYLESAVRARGMIHRPYWWQRVFVGEPELVRNLVHLLMHEGQGERPDGLILHDDNFVEQVIAGLEDAGVRVPVDLELVTHCNFPWAEPTAVPLKRIGYDAAQTLELCLDLIDGQRRGDSVPLMTLVQPRGESDPAKAAVVSNGEMRHA